MVEVTTQEAQRHFGDKLAVASLGAIEKKDGSYRVVHDGTHGIAVNSAMHVRDQLRSPCAGELRTVLPEMLGPCVGLTGDVKHAHRLAKIAPDDWGLQACKTGVGGQHKVTSHVWSWSVVVQLSTRWGKQKSSCSCM